MRNKKHGISFIIDLVVYPFDILVSIEQSDKDFMRDIRKNIPPNCLKEFEKDSSILNLRETTNGRTISLESGETIIRLKKWPITPRDSGIVAHEILHAVTFILWRMGIHFEIEKTDEVYAYLIGYITQKFYEKLQKV